jgi:ABC-type uncharacterized transport system involved in gliding motility auxiliary subunit
LAVRLTGKFKTSFPDGKPDTKEDDKDKEDKTKEAPKEKKQEGLKESVKEGVVVLIGDSDFIYDNYCVQIQNFFGQRLITPRNGNLGLMQNLIEQLMGDSNLIAVRSRAVLNRPFDRVKEIQAQAELKYLSKVKQLEQDLSETQQKLNQLQQNKDKNQRFVLSTEQRNEIARFHAKEAEVKKELKSVRKQLRKDIDSLENRLKWLNVAGMPFLVTVAGIALAMVKRNKTAAK